MATTKTRFTDAEARKWLADMEGKPGRVEYQDTKNPYLRARVSDGKLAWCALVWNPTAKKAQRVTLGNHKSHNVDAARKAAKDAAESIVEGVDVVKEKKAKRATAQRAQKTVADMLDDYIAERAEGRKPLRPATIRSYQHALPALLGEYFHKPIDALDTPTMKKLIAARMRKRVQTNRYGTQREVGSPNSAFVGCCALSRLCRINKVPDPIGDLPATWDDFPRIAARPVRLTKDAAQSLFAWLDDYQAAATNADHMRRQSRMMMVALLTGWRSLTVRQLRWEHFDFAKKRISLPAEIMKNRKPWHGPMSRLLAELLQPLRPRDGRGLVFANTLGGLSNFKDEFTASLPYVCGPHDGRKILAIVLAMNPQVPHYVLKMLIGHSTHGDTTFKNYIDMTDDDDRIRDMRAGTDAIDAFYSAKRGDKKTIRILDRNAEQRRLEMVARRSETRARRAKVATAKRRAMRAA